MDRNNGGMDKSKDARTVESGAASAEAGEGIKSRFGLTRSAEYVGVSDDALAALIFPGDSRTVASADSAAFTELFCRFADLMLYRIAGMRPCGLDADDLMQECSIGLLNAARGFRSDGAASFRTYATVCIDNRLRSVVRGSLRNGQRPLREYVELSELDGDSAELADPTPDPEALVLISESVSELRDRMASMLSETEFSVFTEYLSGASYEQIAAKLGISTKSVDNAIQRARRKLTLPRG